MAFSISYCIVIPACGRRLWTLACKFGGSVHPDNGKATQTALERVGVLSQVWATAARTKESARLQNRGKIPADFSARSLWRAVSP